MKHVPPRRSSKPGRGFHAGTLRRARREPLAFCSYMFVPAMKGVASLQTGTDLSRAPPTTTTTTTLSLPVSSCIIMAHLNINQASSNGTKATKTHTHSCTCGCTHTHTLFRAWDLYNLVLRCFLISGGWMVHSGELSFSHRHDFLLRDCERKLQTTISPLLTVHTAGNPSCTQGTGSARFLPWVFDTLSDITVL